MNIIIDGEVLQNPATGISKSTLELYKSLISELPSLKVTVLHQQPLSSPLPTGMSSLQIGSNFPYVIWRHVILPYYTWKLNPDFIHFPWNENVPFLLKRKTKVILTIHDVLPLIIPNYFKSSQELEKYKKSIQKSINRADLIITVSNYSKTQIKKNFIIKKDPEVIYHGKDSSPENIKPPEFDFEYFLYVGGYDPRKGIEKMLKIFIKLHGNNQIKSKLVLTGSKNYISDSFQNMVDEAKNKGIIIDEGYVSSSHLSSLYSFTKALIYPSKYEGFGLPPLEAMSRGCPVITTPCTSLPEICGNAAYYVNIDNESDFENAILTFDQNSELLEEYKEKGKIQSAKFSWKSSAQKYLSKLNK